MESTQNEMTYFLESEIEEEFQKKYDTDLWFNVYHKLWIKTENVGMVIPLIIFEDLNHGN